MQVRQESPYELVCFLQPKCAHYFPEAVGRPELYGETVVVTRELTYLQHGLIARRLIEVASSRVSRNSDPSRPLSLLSEFRSEGLLEQNRGLSQTRRHPSLSNTTCGLLYGTPSRLRREILTDQLTHPFTHLKLRTFKLSDSSVRVEAVCKDAQDESPLLLCRALAI
jgi:hypothetical protein